MSIVLTSPLPSCVTALPDDQSKSVRTSRLGSPLSAYPYAIGTSRLPSKRATLQSSKLREITVQRIVAFSV